MTGCRQQETTNTGTHGVRGRGASPHWVAPAAACSRLAGSTRGEGHPPVHPPRIPNLFSTAGLAGKGASECTCMGQANFTTKFDSFASFYNKKPRGRLPHRLLTCAHSEARGTAAWARQPAGVVDPLGKSYMAIPAKPVPTPGRGRLHTPLAPTTMHALNVCAHGGVNHLYTGGGNRFSCILHPRFDLGKPFPRI